MSEVKPISDADLERLAALGKTVSDGAMTITICPPRTATGSRFQTYMRAAHGVIRWEGRNYPNKKVRGNNPSLEERSREFDFIADGFAAARAMKRRRSGKN